MNSQEASAVIVKSLQEWSSKSPKLVVGIDGTTAVGKTTILEQLSEKIDVLPVHIDDFMLPISIRQTGLEHTSDPVSYFMRNWFDYQNLRRLIQAFIRDDEQPFKITSYRTGQNPVEIQYDLSRKILVLEGILLFHPEILDDVWHRRIYLNGDEKAIRERRIQREKQRWGEKYINEDDPKSFWSFIFKGLAKYNLEHNPKEKADLIVKLL